MNKTLKKWLIGFFTLIGIILLLAFILPFAFKDKIELKLKNSINSQINGRFDYQSVSLSFFTHFPKVSIQVNEPKLISYFPKDTTSVFSAKEISLAMNFWDLFAKDKPLVLRKIFMDKPIINIIQYNSELANYQIQKSADTTANSGDLEMSLEDFEITNGFINYQDLMESTELRMKNLNFNGSFDLRADKEIMKMKTSIDSLSYASGMMSYLKNVKVNSILNLELDKKNNEIFLKENEINLNALKIICTGKIQTKEDESLSLNLDIKSPGSDFKEIFSIVPYAYTKDYSQLQTKGKFDIQGKIEGNYGGKSNSYPDWNIAVNVSDGAIKYTDKNLEFEQVDFRLVSTNVGPGIDKQVLDIKQFEFYCNHSPVEGKLLIENLIVNPHVVGALKGVVNLSDFSKLIPVEAGVSLSGLVSTDLDFAFTQDQVTSSDFTNMKLAGLIAVRELKYKDPTMPLVSITQMNLDFTPKECVIQNANLILGKSDLQLSGKLNNPLALVAQKGESVGGVKLDCKLLDLNEWMSSDSESDVEDTSTFVLDVARVMNINIAANIKELKYDTYEISDLKGNLLFNKDNIDITNATCILNQNPLSLSAKIKEPVAYVYQNKTLKGIIDLKSNQFDLVKFFNEEPSPNTSKTVEDSEPFLVPENMDLDINFFVDKFLYDKMELNNFGGSLKIIEEEIQMRNLNSSAMGGQMALNGVYNSKNHLKPSFDIKYDLNQIQFNKAFIGFTSFKKFVPIAEYIDGIFNSSFICSGLLGKDMLPELTSLNMNGILETLKGSIKGFKPLDALASKLNIKEFKNLTLQNTKNWFQVENGTVSLRDFDHNIHDINMNINGKHSLTGPMDYKIKLKIPRSKFKNTGINESLETGFSYLKSLALKAGKNLELGTHVNVLVEIGGVLLDPKLNLKLLGTDGQEIDESGKSLISDVGKTISDSVQNRTKEELNKIKQKALDESKKIEDSLRFIANKKAEEAGKKVVDKLGEEASKIVDSTLQNKGKELLEDKLGKEAGKILNESGKAEAEKIKDKLKGWDPFKKKGN